MTFSYRQQQQQLIRQLRWQPAAPLPNVSRVPIRADYAADPALCLTAVVFIPPAVGQTIYRLLVEPLQAVEPAHYYYHPDAMHLTIKNIRRIHHPPRFSQADISKAHQVFTQVVSHHASFPVSLEELVPLATSAALIGFSDERLGQLVRALDCGLNKIGLPDDKQYLSDTVFFGNITLCRYVHPPSENFFAEVARLAHTCRQSLWIEKISMITCNAVCAPPSRTIRHTYTVGSHQKKRLMMHIEHVALWTPDLERLKAFYETWFEAKAGPKYVNPAKQFESCFLSFASGARLELMHRPDIPAGPTSGENQLSGYIHLAISVGSAAAVDALTARLGAAGCPVVDGPRRTGDGYYESVVLDPDGNRVELTV